MGIVDYRTYVSNVGPLFNARGVSGGIAVGLFVSGSYRITSNSISNNQWIHVALVRSGNEHRLYMNGVQEGVTWTSTQNYVNSLATIGAYNFNSITSADKRSWNGYIDEFRISNTARYTANFTPPTEPFVNDENTLLLLHMDGTDASTDFEDDNGVRQKVGVSAVGDAQVDTAQSKFGGASALFDGTGDYLQIPNSTDFDVTGGDFTAEAWVRASDNSNIKTIFGKRTVNQGWWLVLNSGGPLGTGQVQFVAWNGSTASVIAYSDTIISTGAWYHIAIVKDGSNFKLFVDGALEDTQADSGTLVASTNPLLVGRENTTTTRDWNGHLDEVRISNIARYTANFTPATTAFQNDANTLLLLHMDGTDGSTVFRDDNGVTPTTEF
jgi:hypothetical protein